MADFLKNVLLNITKGKECFFIDLNITKTIWWNAHKKKTFKFRKGEYVLLDNYQVDTTKAKRNIIVYHSKYAEPLTFEFDEGKSLYNIRSDEFNTVYNNKLLTQLMYVKEKGYIMMILGLCGLSVIMNAMIYTKMIELYQTLLGV